MDENPHDEKARELYNIEQRNCLLIWRGNKKTKRKPFRKWPLYKNLPAREKDYWRALVQRSNYILGAEENVYS